MAKPRMRAGELREYRKKWLQEGKCVNCGSSKEFEHKRRCEKCLQASRDAKRKRTEYRSSRGLCTACGSEALTSTKANRNPLCEFHYLVQTSQNNFGTNEHAEALKKKLIDQRYTCPYSGALLILGVNASLDHIFPVSRFPELQADISNTEWVSSEINSMKGARTKSEFLSLISAIYTNAVQKPA